MKLRSVYWNRAGGALHGGGIGYSKIDHLARGRMAPPRNWKMAHDAEIQSGVAGGGRPCKNVGLHLKSHWKHFVVL